MQVGDKEVAKDNRFIGFRLRHYFVARRAKQWVAQAIRLQVAFVHEILYLPVIDPRPAQDESIPNWRQSRRVTNRLSNRHLR